MSINSDLNEFAVYLANDPTLVQGPGGNISIKEMDTLYIKASGTWLSQAERQPIFLPIPMVSGASSERERSLPNCQKGGWCVNGRPSIETPLHLALSHRVVVHVHCVSTIAISIRKDAKQFLESLLSGIRWAFVEYHMPGQDLCEMVREVSKGGHVDVVILGNHGLLIGAPSIPSAKELLKRIQSIFGAALPIAAPPKVLSKSIIDVTFPGYKLPKYSEVQWLAFDLEKAKVIAKGSLYPDHVIFLGRRTILDKKMPDDSFNGTMVWIIPGHCVLIRDCVSDAGEEMLRTLSMVASRIQTNVEINYLTSAQETALLNWEAERYRQLVNEGV